MKSCSVQRPVIEKLCGALANGGVILFTAGGVDVEITGQMRGQNFYYSSFRFQRAGLGKQPFTFRGVFRRVQHAGSDAHPGEDGF